MLLSDEMHLFIQGRLSAAYEPNKRPWPYHKMDLQPYYPYAVSVLMCH